MSKTEERLKKVLTEINNDHKNKIDQQIYGIFLCGFMTGVIFSYTSLLGYSAGFITGIIINNNFSNKFNEYIENINYIFSNSLNKMKTLLNIKEKVN